MPKINGLIFALPKHLRKELFARAAGRRSPGYKELENWLAKNGYAVSDTSIHRSLSAFTDIMQHLRRAEFLHCALDEQISFEAALQQVVLMDLSTAIGRLAYSNATRAKRAR